MRKSECTPNGEIVVTLTEEQVRLRGLPPEGTIFEASGQMNREAIVMRVDPLEDYEANLVGEYRIVGARVFLRA